MPATQHLIVGGGQAAVSAAAKLRELDADVHIRLISDEDFLPYQRPPLSKVYLSGQLAIDRLLLRPPDWYENQSIDVHLGSAVRAIDVAGDSVQLSNGESYDFDTLLLATGASPRRLPKEVGGELNGVFTLRSNIDADRIRPYLKSGNRAVIVGGGYIGLEAAAIARGLGLHVTVLEIADRILQRVAAPETSNYFRKLHEGHGVQIREGAGFEKLTGEAGTVRGVRFSNGETLPADLVLVGIGVLPNENLARQAGLTTDNGVMVDEFCRTSNSSIFAAGDCSNFPFSGERTRIESVPHAIHQAEIAASNMVGLAQEYVATPWFWSDQYDVKLQISGLNTGYSYTVTRAGKREGAQSVWYYDDDKLLAVDAMNDAPSFMTARRVIEAGKTIPAEVAADATSNLREWT